MIPVPVILQPPMKTIQPSSGGRQSKAAGFKAKRRSKIPVLSEIEKNKNSIIQASKDVIPAKTKTTRTQPAISVSRSLRTNRPTEASVGLPHNSLDRIQSRQNDTSTRRYPERLRKPPSRFKDYVKH